MELTDYFAILGVPPTADEQTIRDAYRQAARRFHPDANTSPGAEVLFKDINRAYEVLSDSQQRRAFEQLWQDSASTTPGLKIETILSRGALSPLDEPQVLYALLRLHPQVDQAPIATSAPLNLCIVIDRSTSMKGPRLQAVKAAVHQIIDQCSREDVLSVVTFSDSAAVLVPATPLNDPRQAKSLVSTLRADGATAIYQGLRFGLREIERYRDPRYVNHMVLITDGRTYGDEDDCLTLASDAHALGVGISGMGIGEDWHDEFIDELVSRTGGSSTYVSSSQIATHFLNERVRSLATAYAERARLVAAPAPGIEIESIFRLAPDPMPLNLSPQPIPLGTIDAAKGSTVLMQLNITTGATPREALYVSRLDVEARMLGTRPYFERIRDEIVVEVTPTEKPLDPPPVIIDALSRLALYKLQDRAQEALESGNVEYATRKLEYLATRLFESGQDKLAEAALYEARRVIHTHRLSESGSKELKYGTRALLPPIG